MEAVPAAARQLTALDFVQAQFKFTDQDDERLPAHDPGLYKGHIWQAVRPANVNPSNPGYGSWKDRATSADANYVWVKNLTNPRRPAQVLNVQEYFVAQLIKNDPSLLSQLKEHDGSPRVVQKYTGPSLDFRNWRQFTDLADPGAATD